ncbi:putative site-specific recombinase, phage integrase family [Thermosulfurimonas dismutans]|uniref:Putative site-specific recombinase, phage integrase family n=2 Tax=Thermosulfurimonas dismutans TaxID=999894 RepID=A0A179D3M2_9BACT|nr:putative site-specific recombinase, phage integrase family [Thermosulfurimonas dismutans]
MVLLDLEKLVAPPERERKGPRVRIKTKEKCPKCGKAFAETPVGYLCLKCKTVPRRFYIYLSWKGRKIKIYSFKDGQPLSSWELAKRARELIQHEIESGVFDPSKWVKGELKQYLLPTLIKDYLETKKDLKPSTYRDKRNTLRLIEKALGPMDVREIQGVHLHRLAMDWQKEGLSPKTIRNRLVDFRAFLNWLKRRGILQEVPPLPEIRVPEPEIRWLDPETQERILAEIPEVHRPIFEFMFLTGCRPGEARALMWDAVHLKEGFVLIKRTFSADRLVEAPKEGKAKAIPIVGRLRDLFEDLARNKVSMFVFARKVPGYKDPRPYSAKFLSLTFKEACRKAGVEGINLYQAVRHSFAMQLLQLGFTYEQVGAALGHRSPSTTRKYGRLNAMMVAPVFEAKQKVVSLEESRRRKNRE